MLSLRPGSSLCFTMPPFGRGAFLLQRDKGGLVDLIVLKEGLGLNLHLRGKGVRLIKRYASMGKQLTKTCSQKNVPFRTRRGAHIYTKLIKVGRKTIQVFLSTNSHNEPITFQLHMPQGSVIRKIFGKRGIKTRYEKFEEKCNHARRPRMTSYYEDFGFSNPVTCPDCGNVYGL